MLFMYHWQYFWQNCEKDGIDADEVELAVELAGDVPAGKWLREKWMPLVDRVIHSATNQGALMEQNDVGELSLIESKEALKQTGNEMNAARMCVEYRKKLVRIEVLTLTVILMYLYLIRKFEIYWLLQQLQH